MVRFLTAIALTFITFSVSARDFTDYPEQQIRQEFRALEKLESAVLSGGSADPEAILLENPQFISSELLNRESFLSAAGDNDPLNIPSFWWGCCLGALGIILVYIFTDNDKAEAKKAFYGCLVGTGVAVVAYFAYFLFWATTASALAY